LIPRDLERLVSSLLARDRDQRPASAADVLGQLRAIYGTPGTGTLAPEKPPRTIASVLAAAVLVAAVAGLGLWEIRRMSAVQAPANASPPVVAVLPLANISGDTGRDFIAAGIAESLISSLAALPTITVLSRASVSEARNRIAESAALARDLGATYLVEGSVQESGGRLRVSLSLVRLDRSIAWADSIDGEFGQIFDLQSRLAGALTTALAVRVSPDQRLRMTEALTSDPEALSAYWRGRTLLERRDVGGNLDAAAAAFGEAIRRDNEFALAHAALGEAYWAKYVETRESEWPRRAIDEGTTALRMAPDRPEVRHTLAITLAGTGRLDEAVSELNRALTLRPNYEDARRQLALVLARQGKIDDAVSEFRKAIAQRPAGWASWSAMGVSLFQAARYREAIEPFTKVTELQPDSLFGYQQLGAAYQGLADYDRALENYRHSLTIRPNPQAFSNIGAIHHLRGDYQEAVNSYQRALELRPNSHITWRNLGDAYRRLGDARKASDSYARALQLIASELQVDPNDAGNVSLMAVYLAKSGRHAEAKTRIGEALAMAAGDSNILFRSAAVLALAGEARRAIEALEAAVARGIPASRISQEEDFETLRIDPRYKELAQTK